MEEQNLSLDQILPELSSILIQLHTDMDFEAYSDSTNLIVKKISSISGQSTTSI